MKDDYKIIAVFDGIQNYYGTLKVLEDKGKFYVAIEDYDSVDYGYNVSLEEARTLIKIFTGKSPKEIPRQYESNHQNGGYPIYDK